MRKFLVPGALLLLVSGVRAAQAQVPSVVPSLKPSLYAGIAMPTGDFKTGVNSGYTVGGALDLTLPVMPLGFRGEASYTSFGAQGGGETLGDASGRLNVVLPMHLIVATPYLIGGVGYYHFTDKLDQGLSFNENKIGYNVGAGIDLPLGVLAARVEARYNHVSLDNGRSYTYVPITFGLRF